MHGKSWDKRLLPTPRCHVANTVELRGDMIENPAQRSTPIALEATKTTVGG